MTVTKYMHFRIFCLYHLSMIGEKVLAKAEKNNQQDKTKLKQDSVKTLKVYQHD